MAGLFGALAAIVAGSCSSTFSCTDDSECTNEGSNGVCQPATGFCSFPDDKCESGQRYGDLAPDGLAGTCVPAGTAGDGTTTGTTPGTGGAATSDDGSSSGPSVADSTGRAGDTTNATATAADSSTDNGGGESTDSSGGPSRCCDAACPEACGFADCPIETVDGPMRDGGAIDVIIVGQTLVWSTGAGVSLRTVDLDSGTSAELAQFPDNDFVTTIAADQDHVYVQDFDNGGIRRAALDAPGGDVELVVDVPGADGGFGGIAVNGEYVYFGMASGDVWRHPKDGAAIDVPAELVAFAVDPHGVAVDDQSLYFLDNFGEDEVRRIALSDIGDDLDGTMVVREENITAFTIDDSHIFYAHDSTLRRADKLGSNADLTTLGDGIGEARDIEVDALNVYISDALAGAIGIAPKDGSGEVTQLASPAAPWGLALSCDTVYWVDNDLARIDSRLK